MKAVNLTAMVGEGGESRPRNISNLQELFDATPWQEAGCPSSVGGETPPESVKSLTDWARWAEKITKERGIPMPE